MKRVGLHTRHLGAKVCWLLLSEWQTLRPNSLYIHDLDSVSFLLLCLVTTSKDVWKILVCGRLKAFKTMMSMMFFMCFFPPLLYIWCADLLKCLRITPPSYYLFSDRGASLNAKLCKLSSLLPKDARQQTYLAIFCKHFRKKRFIKRSLNSWVDFGG